VVATAVLRGHKVTILPADDEVAPIVVTCKQLLTPSDETALDVCNKYCLAVEESDPDSAKAIRKAKRREREQQREAAREAGERWYEQKLDELRDWVEQ
jgi:hypothetical protein